MAITLGLEVRRYATVTVDTNDLEEAYKQAPQMVLEDDSGISWNAPEVDYLEFLSQTIEADCGSDLAFERRREMVFM